MALKTAPLRRLSPTAKKATPFRSPKIYTSFLLYLLSELFEQLPEVGDLDKPKLVFFFDEAHMLFNDISKALLEKIEQVVRLICSKGVGIYFCMQNPLDVPETILGQMGNRVQHALRAFTPRDQKAVATAASTFRQNPAFDTKKVITELGVGEALVSFLDEKGSPTMVERAVILPPEGQAGPVTPDERQRMMQTSLVFGKYERSVDRELAFARQRLRLGGAGVVPGPDAGGRAGRGCVGLGLHLRDEDRRPGRLPPVRGRALRPRGD